MESMPREDRFRQIGDQVQAAIHRHRWLRRTFALSGSALLIIEAIHYSGPTDYRYVGLYLAYLALPVCLLLYLPLAYTVWRRWRDGWFKEQAEINTLLAAADARGENPDRVYEAYMAEKHPEEFALTPPPSPPRELSDAEMARIYMDSAFTAKVVYNESIPGRLLIVATIGAEEGFFFAPVALFGWPWWALAISMIAWGFLHYPIKNAGACLFTSGFGMLVGLTVLPHGILVNALGHELHDYLVFASQRFSERMSAKLA